MDFFKIHRRYPRGFKVAQDWWGRQGISLVSCPAPIVNFPKEQEVLIRFFDFQGFHIETSWLYEEMVDIGSYEAKIYTKERFPDYTFCSDLYDDRQKALSEALERAFELLEEKINNSSSPEKEK